MANCKSYQELSTHEKVEMIGKLVHAIQSDEICFLTARGMINGAKARGVFSGVTILPDVREEMEHQTTLS